MAARRNASHAPPQEAPLRGSAAAQSMTSYARTGRARRRGGKPTSDHAGALVAPPDPAMRRGVPFQRALPNYCPLCGRSASAAGSPKGPGCSGTVDGRSRCWRGARPGSVRRYRLWNRCCAWNSRPLDGRAARDVCRDWHRGRSRSTHASGRRASRAPVPSPCWDHDGKHPSSQRPGSATSSWSVPPIRGSNTSAAHTATTCNDIGRSRCDVPRTPGYSPQSAPR